MEIQERPTETLLSITPTAAAKIRELMAEEPDGDTMVLRVAIQGGGCSGFQYGLGFDTAPAEGDHELELEGVPVVVDPVQRPVPPGRHDRLPERRSRSPGSRSTTRTPSPRAAAATPSRWKRAEDDVARRRPGRRLRLRLLALSPTAVSVRFSRTSGFQRGSPTAYSRVPH